MKVALYSDLHLEHAFWSPPQTEVDLVVLAGDIANGVDGISWAEENFTNKTVLYVPGNHEFYGHDYKILRDKLYARDYIHVFGKPGVYDSGDWLFVCATLWTDFSYWFQKEFSMKEAGKYINDYHLIKFGERVLEPKDTMAIHMEEFDYIKKVVEANPERNICVVTHMPPSSKSTEAKWLDDPVTGAFVNTLEPFILEHPQIKYWFAGHCHCMSDYRIGECQVMANPRGYASNKPRHRTEKPNIENKSFQEDLTIEL